MKCSNRRVHIETLEANSASAVLVIPSAVMQLSILPAASVNGVGAGQGVITGVQAADVSNVAVIVVMMAALVHLAAVVVVINLFDGLGGAVAHGIVVVGVAARGWVVAAPVHVDASNLGIAGGTRVGRPAFFKALVKFLLAVASRGPTDLIGERTKEELGVSL